ncbi:CDP-diacylglycerol--serine O-phosphatidyltransferase [bacterium]|nr:CDP-diacylglycerol--serine O-phosphatidyltransferase [bacterium]
MRREKPINKNKIIRGVFILPSLLTVGNIFFGFYAIISSLDEKYYRAALAIIFALLLDGLDGSIARLTKSESQFGLNLDSLADVISFGVAPAILIHTAFLYTFGRLGWAISFLYLACGSIRLARFNSQAGREPEQKFFVGLPIPIAAAFMASLVVFFEGNTVHTFLPTATLILTLTVGFLMISTLKYHSFKEIDFKKKRSIKVLFIIAISITIIVSLPQKIPCFLFFTYIISPFILNPLKKILSNFKELDSLYKKIDHHIDE